MGRQRDITTYSETKIKTEIDRNGNRGSQRSRQIRYDENTNMNLTFSLFPQTAPNLRERVYIIKKRQRIW